MSAINTNQIPCLNNESIFGKYNTYYTEETSYLTDLNTLINRDRPWIITPVQGVQRSFVILFKNNENTVSQKTVNFVNDGKFQFFNQELKMSFSKIMQQIIPDNFYYKKKPEEKKEASAPQSAYPTITMMCHAALTEPLIQELLRNPNSFKLTYSGDQEYPVSIYFSKYKDLRPNAQLKPLPLSKHPNSPRFQNHPIEILKIDFKQHSNESIETHNNLHFHFMEFLDSLGLKL